MKITLSNGQYVPVREICDIESLSLRGETLYSDGIKVAWVGLSGKDWYTPDPTGKNTSLGPYKEVKIESMPVGNEIHNMIKERIVEINEEMEHGYLFFSAHTWNRLNAAKEELEKLLEKI